MKSIIQILGIICLSMISSSVYSRDYINPYTRYKYRECLVGQVAIYQEWWLVDNSCARKTTVIEGRVIESKFNASQVIFDDGDLNMFIMPDPAYAWLAKNTNGVINPAENDRPAGNVELEVATITSLIPDAFPNGMHVKASGWHIEDTGHPTPTGMINPKTEIHPVNIIHGNMLAGSNPDSTEKFSLMLARDSSQRFIKDIVDFHNGYSYYSYPMNQYLTIVNPDLGQTGGKSSMGLLVENSILDDNVTSNRSAYASNVNLRNSTIDLAIMLRDLQWGVPYLTISVDQSASIPMPGDQPDLFPSESSLYIDPWTTTEKSVYLAKFQRNELKGVFKDKLTYAIIAGQDGYKRLKLDITAELNDTSDMRIKSSSWTVFSGITQGDVSTLAGDLHQYQFTVYYSPASNETATEWMLAVSARDTNALDLPNIAAKGYSQRKFALENSIYKIRPSSLRLTRPSVINISDSRSGAIGGDLAGTGINQSCGLKSDIDAHPQLLPGVRFVNDRFNWMVGIGEKPTSYRIIQPDRPVETGDGYLFRIDPDNYNHLIFEKGGTDNAHTNQLWTYHTIRIAGKTELGEQLSDQALIATGCLPDINVEELFENAWRAILVLLRYSSRLPDIPDIPDGGIPHIPGERLPTTPDIPGGRFLSQPPVPDSYAPVISGPSTVVLSEIFSRNTKVKYAPLGEPYRVLRKLKGKYRSGVQAFFVLLQGKKMSDKQMTDLQWLASLGANLGWETPPPKNVFKGILPKNHRDR